MNAWIGVEDVDRIRDWWDGEREGDTAGSMLGRLDAVVAQIAADHVRAAMADLDERCSKAIASLDSLTAVSSGAEAERLFAKRTGVSLVRDYIRSHIPPDPTHP